MISELELWYSLGTAFSMGLEGDVQLSGPRSGFPAGSANLLRYLGKTEQAKIGISAALLAFFMVLPAFFLSCGGIHLWNLTLLPPSDMDHTWLERVPFLT